MALSDKVSFNTIKELFGLDQNQVKLLMKAELKPGSYKAWRKRVEKFSARRDVYKQTIDVATSASFFVHILYA